MLKIYCYNKCTTCKKALKWLDDNGIEYALTDIKTDHPDEAKLREQGYQGIRRLRQQETD